MVSCFIEWVLICCYGYLFWWLDYSVWSLHLQAGSCVLLICPHSSLSTSLLCAATTFFSSCVFSWSALTWVGAVRSLGFSQWRRTRWSRARLPVLEAQEIWVNPWDSLLVENGNPFQYICLENSMDREATHGVAKSRHSWAIECSGVRAHAHTHTHTHTVSVLSAIGISLLL